LYTKDETTNSVLHANIMIYTTLKHLQQRICTSYLRKQ